MRISFNSCTLLPVRNNFSNVGKSQYLPCSAHNTAVSEKHGISFCSQAGKLATIGNTNIKKILSEAEYDQVLNRLKNSGTWRGFWNINEANKFESGLMPYAGKEDMSALINGYMQSGIISEYCHLPLQIMKDYVRLVHYALGKLDETYGRYEGYVFRHGWFGAQPQSFVSAARNPEGAVLLMDSRRDLDNFFIIQTRNGHKVEEVQKKLGYNDVYIEESEIVLEPGSTYKEIKERTPEMNELKERLFKAMRPEAGYVSDYIVNVRFFKEC